jgi:hypothetical protein
MRSAVFSKPTPQRDDPNMETEELTFSDNELGHCKGYTSAIECSRSLKLWQAWNNKLYSLRNEWQLPSLVQKFNPAETFGDIMIDYDYVELSSACITGLALFRKDYPHHRSARDVNNLLKLFLKSFDYG